MQIKDVLEYKRFFIRKLSVDLTTQLKREEKKDTQVNLGFGIAPPVIIDEENKKIAVLPFKVDLDAEEVKISSEFIIGLKIKDTQNISTEQDIKNFINMHSKAYTELVNEVINKIVNNALEYTNIRFADAVKIEKLYYQL